MANIDLSKISQEELDSLIKEEVLRIKADMLSENKKMAQVALLSETKKALEKELADMNESMEEGILGGLFGGGNKDAKRKQAIIHLLNHPNKGPELLTYASPEQIEQFKQMAPDRAKAIDSFLARLGSKKQLDPQRAESYINVLVNGGKYIKWDPDKKTYIDTGNVKGAVSGAFAESEDQP